MTEPLRRRTGGQILVDQLKIHGVDMAFGVPGESYLAALDALFEERNQMRFIICRQEGGASNMAEAYGKLTGRPGICFVTRGPGATNASIGVHTAFQDSTPMILLIGQVARDQTEREAFQEIDFRRMFGPVAKWVAEIDERRAHPRMVSQAFHRATSGRPGPVVLALPEDMLTVVEVADAGPYQPIQAHPGPEDMARLREHAGGGQAALDDPGRRRLDRRGLRRHRRPSPRPTSCRSAPPSAARTTSTTAIRTTPATSASASTRSWPSASRQADLLLAIGPRLGEMTTGGYTLIDLPVPKQTLVHVHAGAEELGRVYQATLAINAGMPPSPPAARALAPGRLAAWRQAEAAHADYLANSREPPGPGPVQLGEIVTYLRKRLPPDAIITNGAGNYAAWLHRFYRYRGFRTQLAPTSGAMGYGVPAAVAAKAVHPERIVVCFAGDGCFLMNGQELATAVQYGLPIIVVVVNNGMYGTIRMHQERHYPGRVIGTDLVNPDFAALARAYGAFGETGTTTEEFAPAFERAPGPAASRR